MILNLAWTDFKTQISSGVPFRAISVDDTSYYLSAAIDLLELNFVIPKNGGVDQVDYETNYASLAVTYNLSPLAPGNYRNITGNTTITAKSGPGVLMGIWINNNSTGGAITLYDNTAGSGTKIATIAVGTPSGGLLSNSGIPGAFVYPALNVKFTTGLTIVTSGSTNNDVTIIYR